MLRDYALKVEPKVEIESIKITLPRVSFKTPVQRGFGLDFPDRVLERTDRDGPPLGQSVPYYPSRFNFEKRIRIFTESICWDLPRLNMPRTRPRPVSVGRRGGGEMNGNDQRDRRPQHPCQSQGRAEGWDGGLGCCFLRTGLNSTAKDVAQAPSSCVKDTQQNGENSGSTGKPIRPSPESSPTL